MGSFKEERKKRSLSGHTIAKAVVEEVVPQPIPVGE